MFGLGAPELLLIVFVLLLLFGAKKLPELAQGLGKGVREFKKAMQDTTDDVKGSTDVSNAPKTPNTSVGDASKTESRPKDGGANQN
jgi:sec-independent protein translocase protein TatA